MNLIEVIERIDARLKAVGIDATNASRNAGLSDDAIRNMKRAAKKGQIEGGANVTTITALAPVLQTTSAWLLDGDGPEEAIDQPNPRPATRTVTVASHVQAGHWAETWEWDDDDKYDVAVPADADLAMFRLFAAETRGPSMNRRYPEGTVIVFTDAIDTQEEPIPGKRYVVQRERADGRLEHTVKLLHRDELGKFWLVPESNDLLFQQPISVENGADDGDTIRIIGRVRYSVARE